jgi:hypothetical protein
MSETYAACSAELRGMYTGMYLSIGLSNDAQIVSPVRNMTVPLGRI